MKEECKNVCEPLPLARVTMPMIRVMVDATLSWAERETISLAINVCLIQWHSLKAEYERNTAPSFGVNCKEETK